MLTTPFDPSHPPKTALSGSDRDSFGYATIQSRLPVIVSKIVDDVYRSYHGLPDTDPLKSEKEKEAKKIIEAIGGLRYELQRDKPFRPLLDNYPDVQEWNQALADHYPTSSWYKASWLFAECYLYRRIKEAFALTKHWQDYDPFFEQKRNVFKSSQKAVVAIAERLMTPTNTIITVDSTHSNLDQVNNTLVGSTATRTTAILEKAPATTTSSSSSSLDILISGGPTSQGTKEAFFELAQVCLWGNATDLSLLDNPDQAKVEELQKRMMMTRSDSQTTRSISSSSQTTITTSTTTKEEEARAAQKSELEKHADKILQNDLDQLWDKVKILRNGRIDIILDNAGFELYVDLVFADYLVRAGFASEIVFHAKTIPWFVSDVMPFDFQWTLDQLSLPSAETDHTASAAKSFFDPSELSEQMALKDLGRKWQGYVESGVWKVVGHDYWTSCYPFHHLPTLPSAQDLFQDMSKSDLWIFKGDLNYRKLVYDCKWPTTTPFITAIGTLADPQVPSLVTFRTCKANVVVGLKEGVEERVEKESKNWMVSGEYAVISFSP
ncbi:hypothetical protein BG004_000385 [Podila humilis]|nr:hypothetical protein BG004_000385 [Podila humilis]